MLRTPEDSNSPRLVVIGSDGLTEPKEGGLEKLYGSGTPNPHQIERFAQSRSRND